VDTLTTGCKKIKRIAVYGPSGSGKTTLAKKIAAILGTKAIILDDIFHGPHWRMPEVKVFHEKVRKEISNESWVIDGNYSGVRDFVLEKATLTIILDLPLFLIYSRLVLRTLSRNTFFKYFHTPTPLPLEVRKSGAKEIVHNAIFELAGYARRFKRKKLKPLFVQIDETIGLKNCIIIRRVSEIDTLLKVIEEKRRECAEKN